MPEPGYNDYPYAPENYMPRPYYRDNRYYPNEQRQAYPQNPYYRY